MKVISRSIYCDDHVMHPNKYKFVFYGDVHLGHSLCAKKRFKEEVVDHYKDMPNTYLVDMGDCLDLVVSQTRDPRFKASQLDPKYVGIDDPVDRMIDDYCELVDPIKHKIIALVDSNHHLTISERCGTDPTKRIAAKLWPEDWDQRLLGYAGFLSLTFEITKTRSRRMHFSLCHGIGNGGKTEGGFMTQLGHDASHYRADVHVYGHNHRLAGWDRVMITPNDRGTKIISIKEIRLCSGTYLKGLTDDTTTSYAEKGRFKPNELGHMELNVKFRNNGGEDVYWVKKGFS